MSLEVNNDFISFKLLHLARKASEHLISGQSFTFNVTAASDISTCRLLIDNRQDCHSFLEKLVLPGK